MNGKLKTVWLARHSTAPSSIHIRTVSKGVAEPRSLNVVVGVQQVSISYGEV